MAVEVEKRGKRPVTKVAGPYGHPFHPMLIPLPIGLWVGSFVFDILSRISGDGRVFAEGAYWLIGLGVLTALLAAVFGLMDLFAIPRGTPAFRKALTHMTLNVLTVAGFAVSFFIRMGAGHQEPTPVGLIVLSGVLLAVLSVSGWLGGELAYRYGVRVADEGTQAEGF